MYANKNDYGVSFSWLLFGAFVLLIVGFLAWGLDWIRAPLDIASPQNMQMLSKQANERYQALDAKLMSISAQEDKLQEFEKLYGTGTWPQGKRQEYQQLSGILLNMKTSYNADCGTYMSMWQDEWRSVVAPRDLPTTCEMLN